MVKFWCFVWHIGMQLRVTQCVSQAATAFSSKALVEKGEAPSLAHGQDRPPHEASLHGHSPWIWVGGGMRVASTNEPGRTLKALPGNDLPQMKNVWGVTLPNVVFSITTG